MKKIGDGILFGIGIYISFLLMSLFISVLGISLGSLFLGTLTSVNKNPWSEISGSNILGSNNSTYATGNPIAIYLMLVLFFIVLIIGLYNVHSKNKQIKEKSNSLKKSEENDLKINDIFDDSNNNDLL